MTATVCVLPQRQFHAIALTPPPNDYLTFFCAASDRLGLPGPVRRLFWPFACGLGSTSAPFRRSRGTALYRRGEHSACRRRCRSTPACRSFSYWDEPPSDEQLSLSWRFLLVFGNEQHWINPRANSMPARTDVAKRIVAARGCGLRYQYSIITRGNVRCSSTAPDSVTHVLRTDRNLRAVKCFNCASPASVTCV